MFSIQITIRSPGNNHIITISSPQSHFSRCASHALNFCKNALPTRPLPILEDRMQDYSNPSLFFKLWKIVQHGERHLHKFKVRQLKHFRKHLRNRWPKSECELGWRSHSRPMKTSSLKPCSARPGWAIWSPRNKRTTTVQSLLVWNLETSLFVHPIFPCSWWMNNHAFRQKTPAKTAKDETTYISDLWHQPWNKVNTQNQWVITFDWVTNTFQTKKTMQKVNSWQLLDLVAHTHMAYSKPNIASDSSVSSVSLKNARKCFHGKFWATTKSSLFRIRKTSPWLRLVFCYNRSAADGRRPRPQSWYRRCVDKCHFSSAVSFGGRETKTYPMNDD